MNCRRYSSLAFSLTPRSTWPRRQRNLTPGVACRIKGTDAWVPFGRLSRWLARICALLGHLLWGLALVELFMEVVCPASNSGIFVGFTGGFVSCEYNTIGALE